MRIYFSDLSRPKAAAKLLSHISPDVKLSSVQEAVARATGYRDWHELAGAKAPVPEQSDFDLNQRKQVVLTIADALGISPGNVQHIVAKARLLGNGAWTLDDHLELTTTIWRERAFGAPARGKPGTVVKVRAHGETRPAYLRLAGRPTYVMYDNGPGMCADFEAVTPRTPMNDFVPSRLWLPYGYWTLADGSEVVFARDYLPMWRVADGLVERLDPWLWIEGISETTVFSSQLGTVVWERGRARERALEYLTQNGVSGLPRLVDVMPFLVESGTESTDRSVEQLRQHVGSGAAVPSFARLNHHLAFT